VGAYRTFFDLGSIVGPIISMWVYGVYGASWTFYSGTLLLLVALIPTLWIAETKTKKVVEN
jgi:predicted MFS family arabinose efflux permease